MGTPKRKCYINISSGSGSGCLKQVNMGESNATWIDNVANNRISRR